MIIHVPAVQLRLYIPQYYLYQGSNRGWGDRRKGEGVTLAFSDTFWRQRRWKWELLTFFGKIWVLNQFQRKKLLAENFWTQPFQIILDPKTTKVPEKNSTVKMFRFWNFLLKYILNYSESIPTKRYFTQPFSPILAQKSGLWLFLNFLGLNRKYPLQTFSAVLFRPF